MDAIEQACIAFSPQYNILPATGVFGGRGHQFVRFVDADGSTITIVPSSAAMRECSRIYIKSADWLEGQPMNSIHLCRCMASALRRALNEAFENSLDSQPRCPTDDIENYEEPDE